MPGFHIFLSLLALFLPVLAYGNIPSRARALHKSRYSQVHSLGDAYQFDPRDGWQSVNISDLTYKYEKRHLSEKEHKEPHRSEAPQSFGQEAWSLLKKVFSTLKGLGSPNSVTITWYTGKDLSNPSCWPNTYWSPTDASFVCARTERGWANGPGCFQFLEICNGPAKCIFVRVVDECAGCSTGHLDLTRAAFASLAELDRGKCQVQFRQATSPSHSNWHEDLWGPY
ncbi:hypothetical protein APHAL10511_001779 [Amanita phalloides]|nr:hypothetical protein APHAL10511_001779 [Amanita phalloides]